MKQKLYSGLLARYAICGGLSYVLELTILLSLHRFAGLSVGTSTAIAFWIGLLASFSLQKIIAFKDYKKEIGAISRQLGMFSLLVLFNYAFTLSLVSSFPDKWIIASRTIALMLTTIWNYLVYKKILFSTERIDVQWLIENKIEIFGRYLGKRLSALSHLTERRFFKNSLTVAALLIMLSSATYAGVQATKVQSVASDQFVATYNYSDKGEPAVAVEHTNIIKAPMLWAQGHLPFNLRSLVAFNVGLIVLSFLLWILLLYFVFGDAIVAISALLFSAIMINSTAFSINIAETTIRQIEYPLALIFVLLLSRFLRKKRNYLWPGLMLTIYLSILVLHDRFTLYTVVPAGGVTVLWQLFKGMASKKNSVLSIVILGLSAPLSVLLAKVLTGLHLVNIVYGYVGNQFTIPFEAVPNAVTIAAKQTIDLFGGMVFGVPIKSAFVGMFVCFCLFVCAITSFFVIRKGKSSIQTPTENFLFIYLVWITAFTYAAYITPNMISPDNSRYLTIVVYIGVTMISWMVVKSFSGIRWVYTLACLLLVFTTVVGIPHARFWYRTSPYEAAKKRQQMQVIVADLSRYNVSVIASKGGYQALRFYSNGQVKAAPELFDCRTTVWWSNNSSWERAEPGIARTALLIGDDYGGNGVCKADELQRIYGEPLAVIPDLDSDVHKKDGKVALYIYDYDIRSKFLYH